MQREVEEEAIRASGQKTLKEQVADYVKQRIEEEQKRVGENTRIPYERWADIYADALRRMKAETRTGATLDRHGEFRDFAEVRRPFIAPNHHNVTF